MFAVSKVKSLHSLLCIMFDMQPVLPASARPNPMTVGRSIMCYVLIRSFTFNELTLVWQLMTTEHHMCITFCSL